MAEFDIFAEREKTGWATTEKFDSYENFFASISARFASDMLDLVDVANTDVLDLCCGHGDMTARLVALGARVTGLDFSPEALKRARQRAGDATLVEGDAQEMPFENASFDVVMCNLGLLHVPDRRRCLDEIRRVLRPKGRFCNSSGAAPDRNPAFRVALGSLRPNIHPDHPPPAQPDVFEFGDPEIAARGLDAAGFEIATAIRSEAAWRFDDVNWLFHLFADATITVGTLIHSQPDANVAAIRTSMAETVGNEFGIGDGYEVPACAYIVTAVMR